MDIYLMNTPTDTEHVIKELPDGWDATPYKRTGNVRGEASVDDMTFLVDGNVKDENYCYIPDFRRFYWITLRNVLRTGVTELSLKSDPLMSFYFGYEESGEHVDGIEDLPVYVTRCSPMGREDTELQIGFNSYLRDDGVPVIAKVRTEMHHIPYFLQKGGNGDFVHTSFDFNNGYWLVTVG